MAQAERIGGFKRYFDAVVNVRWKSQMGLLLYGIIDELAS